MGIIPFAPASAARCWSGERASPSLEGARIRVPRPRARTMACVVDFVILSETKDLRSVAFGASPSPLSVVLSPATLGRSWLDETVAAKGGVRLRIVERPGRWMSPDQVAVLV